jgi:RNA polymerase sigma factor (sigma-70 family)
MAVTDYLHIYESFIKNSLNILLVKYCRRKGLTGNRLLDYRDEVVSDLGITFVESLGKQINTDMATYLRCVLEKQVRYSISQQIRSEIRRNKDVSYYIQKYGRYVDGSMVDSREADPREELFRLSFEDFDFSSLNNNELQTIQLFFGENMKLKEIAGILNISESAVRQCKKRALKKLYKPNLHLWN